MQNLKEETIEAITRSEHELADVEQVQCKTARGQVVWPLPEFLALVDRKYDNGYGAVSVNISLLVLFKDGSFLRRDEYDGSEWWTYQELPTPVTSDVKGELADIFDKDTQEYWKREDALKAFGIPDLEDIAWSDEDEYGDRHAELSLADGAVKAGLTRLCEGLYHLDFENGTAARADWALQDELLAMCRRHAKDAARE